MSESIDVRAPMTSGPQQSFFRVTDNIPEEAWYWMAVGSIGLSAALRLAGRAHWSLFVGQWPPTFILFALYHRLIRPSSKL
jgi:hypothetical protein